MTGSGSTRYPRERLQRRRAAGTVFRLDGGVAGAFPTAMSKASQNRRAFKRLLAQGGTLAVPGAYDPVSAMLIERAGFPAVYIGSYATAAARLGLPDVGLVTMEEMAAHAKAVADAVSVPVLADGENGFANAANIWRTVRSFEQAGVCGIHIED